MRDLDVDCEFAIVRQQSKMVLSPDCIVMLMMVLLFRWGSGGCGRTAGGSGGCNARMRNKATDDNSYSNGDKSRRHIAAPFGRRADNCTIAKVVYCMPTPPPPPFRHRRHNRDAVRQFDASFYNIFFIGNTLLARLFVCLSDGNLIMEICVNGDATFTTQLFVHVIAGAVCLL